MQQRIVLLCVMALALVGAAVVVRAAESEGEVEIELHTGTEVEVSTNSEAPVIIRKPTDAPVMTRAFTTRGGRAAQLETTTLLIDGEPVVRLVRVEGQLAGKNAEVTMHFTSLPKAVRKWLRRFVSGKYKKHDLALITKTPGTGVSGTPLSFSRFDYKGVLIRELSFPKLGVADGVFKVRILYQTADETKNVKAMPIANGVSTVRTQFFKLTLQDKDDKKVKGDKMGVRMAKSVHTLNGFKITRSGGFGKQDTTTLKAHFPASSDPKSVVSDWSNWLTQPNDKKLKDKNPKERKGVLTFYHWTGSSMEQTGGEDARGQLKVLFTLTLNDVTIDKLESGDGIATLKVDSVDMSKN